MRKRGDVIMGSSSLKMYTQNSCLAPRLSVIKEINHSPLKLDAIYFVYYLSLRAKLDF